MHGSGAAQLVRSRGSSLHRSPLSHQLFLGFRLIAVCVDHLILFIRISWEGARGLKSFLGRALDCSGMRYPEINLSGGIGMDEPALEGLM